MAEEKPRQFVGSVEFKKGLEGAITNESAISYVDGANGKLIYRGYSIDDLCAGGGGYEETAYLLLNGKLPTRSELDIFNADLALAPHYPPGSERPDRAHRQQMPPHEHAAHRRLHARLPEPEGIRGDGGERL